MSITYFTVQSLHFNLVTVARQIQFAPPRTIATFPSKWPFLLSGSVSSNYSQINRVKNTLFFFSIVAFRACTDRKSAVWLDIGICESPIQKIRVRIANSALKKLIWRRQIIFANSRIKNLAKSRLRSWWPVTWLLKIQFLNNERKMTEQALTGCASETGSVMHSAAPFTVIRAWSDFRMTFSKTQLPQCCLKDEMIYIF